MSVREQVLAYLEERLDRKMFDTWCQRLELNREGENRYSIPVPNVFYREWLERELRRPLEDAFLRLFGSVPTLTFRVEDAAPAREEPPATPKAPMPHIPLLPPPPVVERNDIVLNPKYVFENFVVGSSNRFAHAAALAVSENPAGLYNPLFIHGGVGLGKTHLLQAICHAVLARDPGATILYLSCENFVNDYITAVRRGSLDAFRRKYRNADILVVDDVHFLISKESSQEEFFHTFNALHIAQRQIILSSDQPANDIPTLKAHLMTRFASGLEARIDPPSYETRLAILRDRAEAHGRELPSEILSFIASSIQTNIRELEGAITKIIGLSALSKEPLTLELAQEALRDRTASRASRKISIAEVQGIVAEYYGLKVSDFRARTWRKSTSLARQVCIYLCRRFTAHSLSEIGEAFAGKDHSTIIYSLRKVERLLENDAQIQSDLARLTREIQGHP